MGRGKVLKWAYTRAGETKQIHSSAMAGLPSCKILLLHLLNERYSSFLFLLLLLIFRKPQRVPHRNFRVSLKGHAFSGSKEDQFLRHYRKQRKPGMLAPHGEPNTHNQELKVDTDVGSSCSTLYVYPYLLSTYFCKHMPKSSSPIAEQFSTVWICYNLFNQVPIRHNLGDNYAQYFFFI